MANPTAKRPGYGKRRGPPKIEPRVSPPGLPFLTAAQLAKLGPRRLDVYYARLHAHLRQEWPDWDEYYAAYRAQLDAPYQATPPQGPRKTRS